MAQKEIKNFPEWRNNGINKFEVEEDLDQHIKIYEETKIDDLWNKGYSTGAIRVLADLLDYPRMIKIEEIIKLRKKQKDTGGK